MKLFEVSFTFTKIRDSRLRNIIHSDLKGSNILLDQDLNHIISNFNKAEDAEGSKNTSELSLLS